jgi:sortase (surface protein transpeptidase)
LTLVTCYPFYFIGDAPQRFIVHGTLKQQIVINAVTRQRFASARTERIEHKEQKDD